MKKIKKIYTLWFTFIIIILIWIFFYTNNLNIEKWFINNNYLYNFKTKTTFQKVDLDKFKKQLEQLQKKQKKDISDYREEAKLNDYLGYPWRWVIIYEKNLSWSLDYVHYNNLAYLYKEICFVNKDFTCNKALENFRKCIEQYGSNQAYIDIIEILIKKWDKKNAKIEYEKYKKNYKKSYEYIENLLK